LEIVNGVIRSRTSRAYLRDDGSWTLHPAQAALFSNMLDAASAVQHYGLRGVDFVYMMGGDSAYDMVVELTDCPGVPEQQTACAARP